MKTCGAIAAFAAMVVIAPHALAQGTAGKGALGGTVGVPFFLADEDTKNGQSPRILGQVQFQYAFTDRTRIAASGGFGWIGYKDGTASPYGLYHPGLNDTVNVMDDALTKFQPLSVTLLRSFRAQGRGWVPYVGAGINITRIEIVNDRRKIKDPVTLDSYVNWAPGVHGQAGFEYFLGSNRNVSFDFNGRLAKLFSKDEEQFPSGFTGPHTYATANFGVNVYFWPIGHKPVETAPEPVPEALAPAAPDTTAAPAPPDTTPVPAPVPPPPAPPDTTVVPDTTVTPDTSQVDTTRAPGSQSSLLRRGAAPGASAAASAPAAPATATAAAGKAKASAVPPSAAPPILVTSDDDADEGAVCPAPRTNGETSGMFGVPGVPVAPPRPADTPPEDGGPGVEDRTPEGGPTP